MRASTDFLKLIGPKQAYVGIVGSGHVILPLALRFAEVGFKALGFDIDQSKVDAIHKGRSYIEHIGDAAVARGKERGITATADFFPAGEVDALSICVPTPLNKYRGPDFSFVIDTAEALLPYMRPGQIISLESTTYPGPTDEELKPRTESRRFKVGDKDLVPDATNHDAFDYKMIQHHAKLIADTGGVSMEPTENVVKA